MRPEATLDCNFVSARIRVVEIEIPVEISIPANAQGLVVFGDGVDSDSRNEAQHRLAEVLNEGGFGTVVGNLITAEDALFNPHSGELCSGLDLLERRLIAVTDWIAMQPRLESLPLAYFGAGVGAEACLIAAARRPEVVRAVVACGAKLRHVEGYLKEICCPLLLIYGNDEALSVDKQRLRTARLPDSTYRELVLIGGALDPLEEEKAIEQIVGMTRGWYSRFVVRRSTMSA